MKGFVEHVIRFRVAVLVATAVVTVGLLVQFKNLTVIIDPNNFLPPSHPFVRATNHVEKTFGSKYVLLVGLTPTSGDAMQPAILEKVQRISAGLASVPYVVKENILSLSARKAKNIVGAPKRLTPGPRIPGDNPEIKNPTFFLVLGAIAHSANTCT
jgi:uncharacterized protein